MLIIDLEATCWDQMKRSDQLLITEIISVGVVEVCLKSRVILKKKEFLVRPKNNPILSSYCTELTGITQEQVDSAPDLRIVSKKIRQFFPGSENMIWSAYGDDNNLVVSDFTAKKAVIPFKGSYYDIQELFMMKKGLEKRVNLEKAMEMVGLSFIGRKHNSLVDAENTARLLLEIL